MGNMNRINLGAGNTILKDWFNHDIIKHRSEIDFAFDLNLPEWPLKSDSYDIVRAWDVIEHLENPLHFVNNCWKLLKPNGMLDVKACGWQNRNFWVDITHRKGFDIKSFNYFVPSTKEGKHANFYTDKKWNYIKGYPRYDKVKNVYVKMIPIK